MAMKIKCPECGKNGILMGVHLKPADGGVTSEMHIEHKRSGQGGGPDMDVHRFEAVHPSFAHAANKIKQNVGRSAWSQDGPMSEGPGTEGEDGEEEE